MLRLLATSVAAAVLVTAQPVAPVAYASIEDRASEVLVLFDDDVIEQETFLALDRKGVPPHQVRVRRPNALSVPVPVGTSARELARSLEGLPDVVAVAPVRPGTVRVLGAVPPNDTAYSKSGSNQRAYMGPNDAYPHSIDIEPVWDAVFNGEDHSMVPYRTGVTIAVIDSGVTPSLREDTGDFVSVWDYVDGDADTRDGLGHGTRVASIIRAQTGNSFGIAGALGESRNTVLVYRTINRFGVGNSEDTIMALMDAADRGAKVINASLGDMAVLNAPSNTADPVYNLAPDTAMRAAWDAAVAYCASKGAIVVASSGNSANARFRNGDSYAGLWYPAASPQALAVGSIDPATGDRSSFSCYGPQLDVVAAGESVWQVDPFDTAVADDGTSYSAPLVSGALGLLWSLVPDARATTMRAILTETAEDYPVSSADGPDDEYGAGRLDVASAYESMKTSLPSQAPVSVRIASLSRREARVSWSSAPGTGVFYRYGVAGGPEYETTALSGRLVVPADGPQEVYVRSFARDRWPAQTAGTATVSPNIGRARLEAERLEGVNRYGTSASISRRSHAGGADTVVLASGANWPDALSASPLASATGGPLLLTWQSSLPIDTRNELVRLSPSEVLIIGGTGAVSAEVATAVSRVLPGVRIRRFGGIDRYETAALVAAEVKARRGGIPGARAVIASGMNFPDALSGSPMAASAGWPILLTRQDQVPVHTTQAIARLGISNVLVLGGDGAVSAAARAQLPPLAAPPLAGADRYGTALAVADYAKAAGVLRGASIGFATGRNYPDALSAGPLLAARSAPVVLVDSTPWAAHSWLVGRGDTVVDLTVLGGTGVIGYDLEFDLRNALRAP